MHMQPFPFRHCGQAQKMRNYTFILDLELNQEHSNNVYPLVPNPHPLQPRPSGAEDTGTCHLRLHAGWCRLRPCLFHPTCHRQHLHHCLQPFWFERGGPQMYGPKHALCLCVWWCPSFSLFLVVHPSILFLCHFGGAFFLFPQGTFICTATSAWTAQWVRPVATT